MTRVTLASNEARFMVTHAIEGALRRLKDLDCQQVFSDFTDTAGRTLLANLHTRRREATEFLLELWFVDGNDRSCQSAAAYTTPGDRVVHICGSYFTDRTRGLQNDAAELLVIHELLHALGLPENPPTSRQITAQVTKRCGG